MYLIRFVDNAGGRLHDALYEDRDVWVKERLRIQTLFSTKRKIKSKPILVVDDFDTISVDLLGVNLIFYSDIKAMKRKHDKWQKTAEALEDKPKVGIHA